MNHYMHALRNWQDFSGRTTRTEYWMFQLVNGIIIAILASLYAVIGITTIIASGEVGGVATAILVLGVLYSLFIFVPSLSMVVRRLHDIGKTGWMYLVSFIPAVGGIILVVLTCFPSEPYDNDYGPYKRYK